MKLSTPAILALSILGNAFGTRPKLNQYANITDCQQNRNVLQSDKPLAGALHLGCYTIDPEATMLYLVRGTEGDILGRKFYGSCGVDCVNAGESDALPTGRCTQVGGLTSIGYGKLKKHKDKGR